jgi:hypothetical protein
MAAQIIAFPSRKADRNRLALVGASLQDAFPVVKRDAELALLTQMADHLIASFNDDYCDRFIDRLAAWEAENRSG